MLENKNYNEKEVLTPEGKEKLENRLKELVNIERPKNIEELKLARSQGDLSENADYDAARRKQAEIEGEIKSIQHKLDTYHVINKDSNFKGVQIGSIVTISRSFDNKKITYRIVGSSESDLKSDIPAIACDTPFAASILNHVVGDVVEIATPLKSYSIKIEEIK